MSNRLFDNLKDHLKTKTNITGSVGTGANARIYKNRARQGVSIPYIVVEVFEGSSTEHLQGISGLAENRIQVDCYASTSVAAYDLAESIRLAQSGDGASLQGYRGTMQNIFIYGVTSETGYREGEDPPEKGSDQPRYWCSRDYVIAHSEPTS